jgi:signal transduction histidine kinase
VALNIGICSSILRSPGGLAPETIAIFDLLVFSEVFFVSLLPVNWVIFDALFNIAFSILVLTLWARTPLLAIIMKENFYTIVSRPVQLHIIVTAVLYLWVRSATQAIKRADRAEVVANLEHRLAEQGQQLAQEKRLLDMSIKEIIDTHMRVANGDYNARVPLQQGMLLWQVAGSLNNLLARIQRLQQDALSLQRLMPQLQRLKLMEYERQQLQTTQNRIIQEINSAVQEGRPIHLSLPGTPLDTLARELNGKQLQASTQRSFFDS